MKIVNTRTLTTAYPVRQFMHGFNSTNIYEFYKKLVISVQSMATSGKLKEVNGYVKKPKTR